jgi:hypothetical protein
MLAASCRTSPGRGRGSTFLYALDLGGVWESSDAADTLALRPDIKTRWTHGWAHAPGNPVDVLYALGLTFSFGTIH